MKDKNVKPDDRVRGMLLFIREDLAFKEVEEHNGFKRCSYTENC